MYSVGWVKCNSKQRIKFQTYTNSTFLIFIRPYLSLFHHSYPILIILVFLLLNSFILFRLLSCWCGKLIFSPCFSLSYFALLLLDYLSFTLPPPSLSIIVLLLILILSPKSQSSLLYLSSLFFILIFSPSSCFSLFNLAFLSFTFLLSLLSCFSLLLLRPTFYKSFSIFIMNTMI